MNRQNSIIIVGGDNTSGWSEKMSGDELEIVSNAGVVLLQRVIPDSINIQVSKLNITMGRPLSKYKLLRHLCSYAPQMARKSPKFSRTYLNLKTL
ncbi:hypothetical protein YC2023_098819 [Brassica napus]